MNTPYLSIRWIFLAFVLSTAGCKGRSQLPKSFAGIQMSNAKLWSKDVMLGGQLQPRDLPILKQHKFKTILNLRSKGEHSWDEKSAVESTGMKYLSLPIKGAKGLTKANAESFHKILSNKKNYPILIHCGSGNRVGAMLAMQAFYHRKMAQKEALDLGTKAGMRSSLRRHLQSTMNKK